jgi:hypothetical protein
MFVETMQQRIAQLSAQSYRSIGEEHELRAVLGFQAIYEAAKHEGLKAFAGWAVHDTVGFLFQNQHTKPFPDLVATPLAALLPELPEPTMAQKKCEKDPPAIAPGLSRRQMGIMSALGITAALQTNILIRPIAQNLSLSGQIRLHGLTSTASFIVGNIGGYFLTRMTQEAKRLKTNDTYDFVYRVTGGSNKARMTVIEPTMQAPSLDNIARDMVRWLESFYKLQQEYAQKAENNPSAGRQI